MENTLELHHRPYAPEEPVVRMDETIKQLTKEVIAPLPPEPGQPGRSDTLYRRDGVATIFMLCEPLGGWRRVAVTESKTRPNWAWQIRRLMDEDYPNAGKVHLVMDNLNTHGGASLHEAFAPGRSSATSGAPRISSYAQARQLAQHRRDRIECAIAAMPGPAHFRRADIGFRNRGMAIGKKTSREQGMLAVHGRRRPDQTQKTLPIIMRWSQY